jgi:hypothetical protein
MDVLTIELGQVLEFIAFKDSYLNDRFIGGSVFSYLKY